MTEAASAQFHDEPQNPKRQFERHSCRVKMRCRRAKPVALGSAQEKYTDGFVRNQSLGGLLLESPIYFPQDIKLEVAFHSPDDKKAFLGVVTVKWCRRVGNAWYLGVSTVRMDKF